MTTKQTDTVAMTEQQLDAVAGGAPHYTDFGGRLQNLVYESFDRKTNQYKNDRLGRVNRLDAGRGACGVTGWGLDDVG